MVAPVIIRRREVQKLTGFSRASIYRLMAAGEFPPPIKIGVRAVAWRISDIEAWLASRTTASYGTAA